MFIGQDAFHKIIRQAVTLGVVSKSIGPKIKPVEAAGAPPLLVLPESWPYFWRHGQWNELRARISGNPPTVVTWINGVKFMEYTDTEKRLPDSGGIALQVHGGGDLTTQFVRYRNIRIKKL